jgi:serine/threonine protein kinase
MTTGNTDGCPDENTLALMVEGAIGDELRATLEGHLDACESCSNLIAELGLATPPRELPARYRLIGQLGVGAMGVVWEAEDTALGRKVALKFLRDDASGDREYRGRLMREARALAQVRHPNVIAVHDLGKLGEDADAELFLALELVVGADSRSWRNASARSPTEILAVWRQVAAGLAAVHGAGIVHRDLKPENVLVADDGRAVITDFGLAAGAFPRDLSALTRTGRLVGTPLYMAIEQLRGRPATAKSDQFSLCVCIWEALVGERPFPPQKSLAKHGFALLDPPKPPPGLDRAVYDILVRGLDPEADKRWPDVATLMAAIELAFRPASLPRAFVNFVAGWWSERRRR